MRNVSIALLIFIVAIALFAAFHNTAGARPDESGGMEQVLQNQKVIIEKLDAIDKKIDVLKMRIRQ